MSRRPDRRILLSQSPQECARCLGDRDGFRMPFSCHLNGCLFLTPRTRTSPVVAPSPHGHAVPCSTGSVSRHTTLLVIAASAAQTRGRGQSLVHPVVRRDIAGGARRNARRSAATWPVPGKRRSARTGARALRRPTPRAQPALVQDAIAGGGRSRSLLGASRLSTPAADDSSTVPLPGRPTWATHTARSPRRDDRSYRCEHEQ